MMKELNLIQENNLNKWNKQKMRLYKNMENIVGIVIETLYYLMNMNLLAFRVDIT